MPNETTRRNFLKTAGALLGISSVLAVPRRAAAGPATQADAIEQICKLASASPIANYQWLNRGRAPSGYIKGMAVSFARVYTDLRAGNAAAVEMARAMRGDEKKDALKHYEEVFQQTGMDNSKDGPDTLRHLFVLMLGLGMRESSGRYCEGRDRAANNIDGETAEAGLFQTSYNARSASSLLPQLFTQFSEKPQPNYLDLFCQGVRPKGIDLENFGEGEGRDFQKLSKECPFFALLFAGVGLRNIRRHWGPINRRAAEVKPDADVMFQQVQELVDREKLGPLL